MAIKNPWPNIKDMEFNDNTTLSSAMINSGFEFIKNQEVVKTVEGSSVEFKNCNTDPFIKVLCDINPTQSGTGEPSPDNVRPITGYSTVNVHNGDTVYPVALGQTVYGGEVEAIEGTLTEKLYKVSPGNDFIFTIDSQTSTICVCSFGFVLNNIPKGKNQGVCISNRFSKNIPSGIAGRMVLTSNQIYLVIPKADATTWNITEVKQWLADNPTDICYELDTLTETQITPVTIESIEGNNSLYHDANGDITVKYKTTIRFLMNQ